MIYIYYTFMVPLNLAITLLAVIIAPILPAFASPKEGPLNNNGSWGIGPRLPSWLSWFQTPDNSLYGDSTFIQHNGESYWSQVKWLWRNPAYSFGLKYLHSPYTATYSGDTSIRDNDNARAGWCLVHANNLFLFRCVVPIGFQRCIYCNFGWNIMGLVDPNVNPKPDPWEATFAFSPRISGFR